MADSIEDLPTEAEREAARKIVAILEPMSPKERRRTVERWMAREAGMKRFKEIFGQK